MGSKGNGGKPMTQPKRTLIIAHRGASADAPENTLASQKLAWEQNADALELDVHLTKDGEAAVSHDGNTLRTTGVNLNIADCTMAELKKLDAGSFKGPQFRGEKIPTLDEILEGMKPGKLVVIELKSGEGIPARTAKAIRGDKAQDSAVIISFSSCLLKTAKALMPHIPACLLLGTPQDPQTKAWLEYPAEAIETAVREGFDGLDLHYAGITSAFATAAKHSGLRLYAWTVDAPDEARRLAAIGMDGITTNKPAFIREALKLT